MRELFTLLLSITSAISFSQPKIDCDSLLLKEIPFHSGNKQQETLEIKDDLKIIGQCAFDSIDQLIFSNNQLLGYFLLEIMPRKSDSVKVNYQDLLNKLNEYKQTDAYINLRSLQERSIELVNRKANINNWEKDKLDFINLQIPIPDSVLAAIYNYMLQANDSTKTYKEILEEIKKNR